MRSSEAFDSWSNRNQGTRYLRHVRNEHASLLRVIKNRGSFWKCKQNSRGGSSLRELQGLVCTNTSLLCTSIFFLSLFQKLCSSNGRRFSAAVSPFPHSRCPRRCATLSCLDSSRRLTVLISHCDEMHSQGLINEMKDNTSVVTIFPNFYANSWRSKGPRTDVHCANFSSPSFVTVHPLLG